MPLLLLLRSLQDSPSETGAPAAGNPFGSWMPILLVLAIFYFVLIRPERKKQKERQAMLGALKKGDPVMTSSGIHGTVVTIADDVVVLQVAEDVRMRFARAAIQTVIPKAGAVEQPTAATGKA